MSLQKVNSSGQNRRVASSKHREPQKIDFVGKLKKTTESVFKSLERLNIFSRNLSRQTHRQQSQNGKTARAKHTYQPLEKGLKTLHGSISEVLKKVLVFVQKRFEAQLNRENGRHLAQNMRVLKDLLKRAEEKSNFDKSDRLGLVGMSKAEAEGVQSSLEVRKELAAECDRCRDKLKALASEIEKANKEGLKLSSTGERNLIRENLEVLHEIETADKKLMAFEKDIKKTLGEKSPFVFGYSKATN